VLKQRVITSIILIPFVILATCYLDTSHFAVFCAVFICVGAWEWAGICGLKTPLKRGGYSILIIAALAGCYYYKTTSLSYLIILSALIWWHLAMVMVLIYQKKRALIIDSSLLKAAMGMWVLVPAWLSFVILHARGANGIVLVLFLLILIWVADIAAFFTGKRWGKTKLSSNVSPGKSWEGVFGAVVASMIMALAYTTMTGMQGIRILVFLSICLVTVLGSVLGDLLESVIKRSGDMKDSGSSIPGHGGDGPY